MKIEVKKTAKGNVKITVDPKLAEMLNSILWDVAGPRELNLLSDSLDDAGVGHDALRFKALGSFDKNAIFVRELP